jgi:hypothetical protein
VKESLESGNAVAEPDDVIPVIKYSRAVEPDNAVALSQEEPEPSGTKSEEGDTNADHVSETPNNVGEVDTGYTSVLGVQTPWLCLHRDLA